MNSEEEKEREQNLHSSRKSRFAPKREAINKKDLKNEEKQNLKVTFAEGTLSPKKVGGVLKLKKGRANRVKRAKKGLESKVTSKLPGLGDTDEDTDDNSEGIGEEDWFLDSQDSKIRPFTTDGLRVGKIINSSKLIIRLIW